MINNELEELIVPELDALGFECVKLEVVGSSRNPLVRLYIDKPGGVTVRDCSLASRTIAILLEEKDPFPGRYLLEVSSPGNNRPLVTQEHFQRFVGKTAKVTAVDASGRNTYTGPIRSCINDVITLDTDDGAVEIGLSQVAKAQLVDQEYKIDKKQKKAKRSPRRSRGGNGTES